MTRPTHSLGTIVLAPGLALATLLSLGGCSYVLGTANAGIEPFESSPTPAASIAQGSKLAGWVLGAPLDLATLPLALAAWASPCGDLATFADVITAPSIGLGYATEAVVGAPAFVLAACLTPDEPGSGEPSSSGPSSSGSSASASSSSAPSAVASSTTATAVVSSWQPEPSLLPWGLVVEHRPARTPTRAPRPLERADLAAYEVPSGAAQTLARAVALAEQAREDDGEPVSTPLDTFGWNGTLEVSWADSSSDDPRPLVVMTPPSQGTFAARWLARRYARRGFHAAVLVPEGDYLEPGLAPEALEAKLRSGIVAARTVVAALGASPRVSRVVYLGISAGGIVGSLLLALEPRVERAALIFPGGNLARIAETSEESTVRDFRESWTSRGLSPAELRARLEATIKTEPLRLAPAIDTSRVLLFLADSDTLVPLACGLELRQALGEPETWLISGEHEVAGCSFGFILHEADAFLGCD